MSETEETLIFYDLFYIPEWLMSQVLYTVSKIVITHTASATAHFILFTVFLLISAIRVVNADVRKIRRKTGPRNEKLATVKLLSSKFLDLKAVVKKLNKTFGMLILVTSLADMVAAVSLLAFALRTELEQQPDESDSEFEVRQILLAVKAKLSYWERGVDVANALIRLAVFLAWHNQVNEHSVNLPTAEAVVEFQTSMRHSSVE